MLGIVSIVLCCPCYAGFWAGIPAVILGFLGKNKAEQGLATNRQLAIAGLICGAVGIVLSIILVLLAIFGHFNVGNFRNMNNN